MRARGEDKTDWARVDAMREGELAASIAADPDWRGVPPHWYEEAKAGLPFPAPEPKRQVTIRLDVDVLEHFRRGGRGWQSRINAVLKSFVKADQRQR